MEEIFIENLTKQLTTNISDKVLLAYFSHEELLHFADNLNKGNFNEIALRLNTSSYNIDIEQDFPKQIIMSIHLFCLVKTKKYETAKNLLNSSKISNKKLFPLEYLSIKLTCSNATDLLKGIKEYNNLLNKYDNIEDKDDWEAKIEFTYFKFFFEKLFLIKERSSKIKKCYFEIKTCFTKLNLISEANKIISLLLERYPNDMFILLEAYKQSINSGSLKEAKVIYERLVERNNILENKYETYVLFCDFISSISQGNYDKSLSFLIQIIQNHSGSPLIMNNISLINFYLNKIEKSKADFHKIIEKAEMNCSNEISSYNLQIISEILTIIPKK